MGKGGTTIILERAKGSVGVDLITGCGEKAGTIIVAKVISLRNDRATIVIDVTARRSGSKDGVMELKGCAVGIENTAGRVNRCVAAEGRIRNGQDCFIKDGASFAVGRVAADGTVANEQRSDVLDASSGGQPSLIRDGAIRRVIANCAVGNSPISPSDDAASVDA